MLCGLSEAAPNPLSPGPTGFRNQPLVPPGSGDDKEDVGVGIWGVSSATRVAGLRSS